MMSGADGIEAYVFRYLYLECTASVWKTLNHYWLGTGPYPLLDPYFTRKNTHKRVGGPSGGLFVSRVKHDQRDFPSSPALYMAGSCQTQ
jgi:hypothetical protein